MPPNVTCPNPSCGKSYQVSEEYLGRRGRCKSCGTEFVFAASTSASGKSSAASVSAGAGISGPGSATSRTGRTSIPSRLGRFQILERVGMGGFGTVYRAHDPQLQRAVALKLLQSTGDEKRDQQRINRFLVEGRAGARLQHPYIVPVFDAGRDEETGEYYLAAAFISGKPLSAAIDGQALELRLAATIVSRLASALEYAHGQGILHRDIKPDNVMLDEQGAPHLMDFGLARMEESESHLTRDGAVMGTPSYMSPEQCVGKQDALGPAADQYSLGCLFYELLTGEKLFDGPVSVQIHHQINTEAPAPSTRNSAVPKDLDTICLKTLSKEPANRYATCAALVADLDRWLSDEPIQARQLTTWERWNRWRRRNPAIAWLSMSTAALLLIVAVISSAAVVRLRSLADGERKAKEAALAAEEQAGQKAIEAEQARVFADQKTAETQRTARNLEREVYKQLIARSYQEWQNNRVRVAEKLLEKCPAALRGWEWQYCRRLCRMERLRFDHHKDAVAAALFSPDGKLVVSASEDGNLKLWDSQTGTERFSHNFALQKRYRARSQFLAFTPDGKQFAAACEDGVVRLWDTSTGKELWKLDRQGDYVAALAISPDGRRMAVGQASFQYHPTAVVAKVWDITTRQPVLTLEGHQTSVPGLAFSPNGTQIASGDIPGNIKIWSAATGTVQQTITGIDGGVYCLAFSPNGQTLGTCGSNSTSKFWDTNTGKLTTTLAGVSGFAMGISFSPDGRLVATSGGASIKVWEVETGLQLRSLRGHSAETNTVCFSKDNQSLVSASSDGTVKIWDPAADQQFTKIDFHLKNNKYAVWVNAVKFSPDGKFLATGALERENPDVKLFETSGSKKIFRKFSVLNPYCIDFSADRSLISVAGKGAAKVWSMKDGKELASGPHDPGYSSPHCARLSPQGDRLAWSSQKVVQILEIKSGKVLQKYSRHQDDVIYIAFAPDGKHVASLSDDGMVRVWDSATAEDLFARTSPHPKGGWNIPRAAENDAWICLL